MSVQRTSAGNLYDAIVIGGGGAGCPLAQTLIEKGKHVLLLERGGLKGENSFQKENAFDALVENDCIEIFNGKGVVLATGNCLGGATTFNQGVWIEDLPGFFTEIGSLFSANAIAEAYQYIRSRIAPVTKNAPGSKQETYTNEYTRAASVATGIPIANVTPGAPELQIDGIWRTHSIFDPETNQRMSADTLLDTNNSYLHLKLETEVKRVTFDGSKARCVEAVKDGQYKTFCIKSSGRIYITAGAFHTPRLLVESGIGPGGETFDNELVGKGFSDKPMFAMTSFFQPGFSFDDDIGTIIEIVATKTAYLSSGKTRLRLVEEISTGKDGDLINFARFERILLPRYLRFSILAPALEIVFGFCNNQLVNDGLLSFLCFPFQALYDAGCTGSVAGFAVFLSDPSSAGEVRVNRDGSLSIDPGYLSTEDDTEALGSTIRMAAPIFAERSGPSAPAQPGDTCPDLYSLIQNLVAVATLKFSYCGFPSAQYDPNWVGPGLDKLTDKKMGERVKPWLISPHHFAGTAAIGKVVDENFKVIGVEGLYVADASVVPKTPRVNMMATAMIMGRLAGLAFD